MAINFVNSTLEITNHGPINMETISTFEKYEHQATAIENGRFQIMFLRDNPSNGGKEVYWKYNKECDRDKEYDLLVATVSQPLK